MLEAIVLKRSMLLETFCKQLMAERTTCCAKCIAASGSPLDKCVKIIDCTKIKLQGPEGLNNSQRAVQTEHERFLCLIYQSTTTHNSLIFHKYDPEVGRRHDTFLHSQNEMDLIMQESLLIARLQVYIYVDSAYM